MYKIRKISDDEFVGEVIDFKPEENEMVFTRPLEANIFPRDVCGDGSDEYLHNNPLALWPNTRQNPVTYFIDSSVQAIEIRDGIRDSFNEWNSVAGYDLFNEVSNASEAKVIVSIGPIDQPGGTLARARWTWNGSLQIVKADIVFDSYESWGYLSQLNCGAFGKIFDIVSVAMHEIGHILGLNHAPTDNKQTMYFSVSPGATLYRTLGNGDKKGFYDAYGIVPDTEPKPIVVQDFDVEVQIDTPIEINFKATGGNGEYIFEIVDEPENGIIEQLDDDTFEYEGDAIGEDSFTYRAKDSDGNGSNVGTVSIEILDNEPEPEDNIKPVAVKQLVKYDKKPTIASIRIQGTDEDGDYPLKFKIVDEPRKGTIRAVLKRDQDEALVLYVPDFGFTFGEDSFGFTVTDDKGLESDPAGVIIKIGEELPKENHPPVVENITVETKYNTETTIELKGSDEDGDEIEFDLGSVEPGNGIVVFVDESKVVYTPDEGFSGRDAFTYVAIDEEGDESEEGIVEIIILPKREGHKFTEEEIENIEVMKIEYADLISQGKFDEAAELLEETQEYILGILVELHS